MTEPMNRRAVLGAFAGASAALGATTAAKGATPHPNGSGKPATFEDLAAVEFEPWTDGGEGFELPSQADWMEEAEDSYRVLSLAWAAMHKTKAELEDASRSLDDDDLLDAASKDFIRTEKNFEACAKVVRTAELRLMSAFLAYLKREMPEEFAEL